MRGFQILQRIQQKIEQAHEAVAAARRASEVQPAVKKK
jgi:hypothetical protein